MRGLETGLGLGFFHPTVLSAPPLLNFRLSPPREPQLSRHHSDRWGEKAKSLCNYISHHAPGHQGAGLSLRPETRADPREPGGVRHERQSVGELLRSRPTAEAADPLSRSRPLESRPVLGTATSGLIWPLLLGPARCTEMLAEVRGQGLLPAFLAGVAWAPLAHLQVPRVGDLRALR